MELELDTKAWNKSFSALMKDLTDVEKELKDEINGALLEGAEIIRVEAEKEAPEDPDMTNHGGNTFIVENKTKSPGGSFKQVKVTTSKDDSKGDFGNTHYKGGKWKNDGYYLNFTEYGRTDKNGRFYPPNPFFRPLIDRLSGMVKDKIVTRLNDVLGKDRRR